MDLPHKVGWLADLGRPKRKAYCRSAATIRCHRTGVVLPIKIENIKKTFLPIYPRTTVVSQWTRSQGQSQDFRPAQLIKWGSENEVGFSKSRRLPYERIYHHFAQSLLSINGGAIFTIQHLDFLFKKEVPCWNDHGRDRKDPLPAASTASRTIRYPSWAAYSHCSSRISRFRKVYHLIFVNQIIQHKQRGADPSSSHGMIKPRSRFARFPIWGPCSNVYPGWISLLTGIAFENAVSWMPLSTKRRPIHIQCRSFRGPCSSVEKNSCNRNWWP